MTSRTRGLQQGRRITDVNTGRHQGNGEYSFQVVTASRRRFRAVLPSPIFTPVPQAVVEKVGEKVIAPEKHPVRTAPTSWSPARTTNRS